VWQLISPILGLLIVVIFKEIGVVNLLTFADKTIVVPFPQLFNFDMKTLSSLTGGLIRVSNCDQWYMYEFEDSATEADRAFFGYNDGTPWNRPNTSGMINANGGILNYPCPMVNRTVPYFKEFSPEVYPGNETMADYLVSIVKSFNTLSLDFNDKDP